MLYYHSKVSELLYYHSKVSEMLYYRSKVNEVLYYHSKVGTPRRYTTIVTIVQIPTHTPIYKLYDLVLEMELWKVAATDRDQMTGSWSERPSLKHLVKPTASQRSVLIENRRGRLGACTSCEGFLARTNKL